MVSSYPCAWLYPIRFFVRLFVSSCETMAMFAMSESKESDHSLKGKLLHSARSHNPPFLLHLGWSSSPQLVNRNKYE